MVKRCLRLIGIAFVAMSPMAVLASTETSDDSDTQAQVHGLRPYTAEYKTTARGMRITLKRELKLSSGGFYTLTNGGKLLVAGFLEKSVFKVDGTHILPGSYVYQGSGLINRRREVHFTEGADSIRSLYKDKWYELPYSEGTLDRMSQQEHLRLMLLNDPTPKDDIVITVADGKRIKEYQLVFRGEEMVDTPMGPVKTFHFERLHDDADRRSDVWLAPEWDYMMVKTLHVEDNKPVEAVLTKGTIDGVKLATK